MVTCFLAVRATLKFSVWHLDAVTASLSPPTAGPLPQADPLSTSFPPSPALKSELLEKEQERVMLS